MRCGSQLEWNAGRIDQRQRANEVGSGVGEVNCHLSAHRVADQMYRFAQRGVDPARQYGRDFVEVQWKVTAAQKKTVAAEADQIEREDAVLARQIVHVAAPPI